MTELAQVAGRRATVCAIFAALALVIYRFVPSAAPGAPEAAAPCAASLILAFGFLFALSAEAEARRTAAVPALFTIAVLAGTLSLGLLAPAMRLIAGYVSFGALLVCLWPLARRGLERLGASRWPAGAAGLALVAAVSADVAWRVSVGRPYMFSDYMICRLFAVQIAEALRGGIGLFTGVVKTISAEYSFLPPLLPSLALAVGDPLSRPLFLGAVLLLYAAPAYLALGLWAREIARASGAAAAGAGPLALAFGLVFAAAPGALALVALGMPDLGGVAIGILALAAGRRWVAALSREAGAGAAPVQRGVELVALLFLLFLFRRWYLFCAVGVGAAVAIEAALLAASGHLRWRQALAAGGAMGLVALAMASPVALDWLPDLKAHDYAAIYAGYNYEIPRLVLLLGDAYGFGVLALAGLSIAALFARRLDNAPLRMTVVSVFVAAALQLRVQSPTAQHFYLLLPLIASPVAAQGLLARPRVAAVGLFVLAAFALPPLSGWLAPARVVSVDAIPALPRADLAELLRLRGWIDAHASPERRYCALGSSPVFSGVLLDDLWQLEPARLPDFEEAKKAAVILPQVDGRDGPPGAAIARCAYLLAASPVQTSLDPQFMQSVALPSAEALAGDGIGARYRRTGETFRLENGVEVIVLERTEPVTDDDVAGLDARWRAAPRNAAARRAVERFF